VLDKRHRGFYALASPSYLARNLDETQSAKPPLANASPLSKRPHVTIERHQDRVVCLRCGADQWVRRPRCNGFSKPNYMMTASTKAIAD
jgi:hypothetical protein